MPPELRTDLLVALALDVEAEHVDLEARQELLHRRPEGAHALVGHHPVGRVGTVVADQEVLDAALARARATS